MAEAEVVAQGVGALWWAVGKSDAAVRARRGEGKGLGAHLVGAVRQEGGERELE